MYHRFGPAMRHLATGFVSALAIMATTMPARAAGDLLVAPTRVVLDGQRGTEVILNNVGADEATYRISLELRRMEADGSLSEVVPGSENAVEIATKEMIQYAPRRVTLIPNQPQSIRIGLRPPANLPDGEYRGHLMFRAIPKAEPVPAGAAEATGLAIQLIPIYGVTIPVIVRKGNLSGAATLSGAHLRQDKDGHWLSFDLTRSGERSVYGEVRVTKPGVEQPVVMARGVAIYPELNRRTVDLPISADQAQALRGAEATISYHEPAESGGALIARIGATLR